MKYVESVFGDSKLKTKDGTKWRGGDSAVFLGLAMDFGEVMAGL